MSILAHATGDQTYPDEIVLEDDYPVHAGYLYVVDGRIERSDVFGTIRDLRSDIIAKKRSADAVWRCSYARMADHERMLNDEAMRNGTTSVEMKTAQIGARQNVHVHNRAGWRKKRRK